MSETESTDDQPADQQPSKAVDWWANCFPQWKRNQSPTPEDE